MARKRSKSTKPTTLCFDFPPDLLPQVLGRLPVKTLLKFRCISKEWRCLIDSSEFASLHFNLYNYTRQNPPLFLIEDGCGGRLCMIRRADTFRKIHQLDFGYLQPVGYANGFVLCCKLGGGKVVSFVIWNPSTRKSTKIAYRPRSHYSTGKFRAFLVDTAAGVANNDCKLVVVPFEHWSWRRAIYCKESTPSIVLIEVYSFNTGSWKSCHIDSKCISGLKNHYRAIIPLNGALHWIGHNCMNKPCIVVFDVQNDVLRYFSLPAVILDIQSVRLQILHESLVLVKRENKGYHIWVMERYGVDESWAMERYGVDQFWVDRVQIDTIYKALFVHIRRNGIFFTSGRPMEVFDVGGTKIMNLGKNDRGIIGLMDTFVETLALLPGGYKQS